LREKAVAGRDRSRMFAPLCSVLLGTAVGPCSPDGIRPAIQLLLADSVDSHHHLVMPGATRTMGHAWYVSTVLLTSCGFYMWPHTFGTAFTARSADTLRRNAVLMPLYSITLPLVFFVGFSALIVVPGLADGDLSLLTVVRQGFPPWFLGVVGGAGALTAMVPAAPQIDFG